MARKMTLREWQVERAYKQYTPPQIKALTPALTGVYVPHDLAVVTCVCSKEFNPAHIGRHKRTKCKG